MPATIQQPQPRFTPETHPRLWRIILWVMFPVSVIGHPIETFKLIRTLRDSRRMGYRLRDTRRIARAIRTLDANCQADMSRAIANHVTDCVAGYGLDQTMHAALMTYAAEITDPRRGLDG